MMKHLREFQRALCALGATDVTFERNGKHYKVRYCHTAPSGLIKVERTALIASSPADADDAVRKSLQQVRRDLGMTSAGQQKTPAQRQSRPSASRGRIQTATQVAAAVAWSAGDHRQPLHGLLATHPAWLAAQSERAWLALWREAMAAVGGRSRL